MSSDKALRFVAKCIHCGRAKNMHRAFTLDCPTGKRTPTGYTTFGPKCFTLAEEQSPESDLTAEAERQDG